MEYKDNLLGVLKTIFKWKKQILYACLIAGIGTVVISLFLDNWYESYTIFYAASPDQALPEPVGVEDTDRDYFGESEDVDRILSIAESNEVANFLIDKHNLYEVYNIDTTHRLAPHLVGKAFRSHFEVKKTKFGAIRVSMEAKDPILAAAIANDARWKVEDIAQNLVKTNQRDKMNTLNETISTKIKGMDVLGDSMQRVRERFGVYNTITQSEGLARQISQTEGKLARERARRQILSEKRSQVWQDTIAMIDAMVTGMESQLVTLNDILSNFNKGVAKVELLEDLHEQGAEQLSLDQERYKQLEAVSNNHINTIFIVEQADVPLYKSRPKRSIICVAAVFITFILSIIAVLILEAYKDVNWREIYNAK